MNHDTCSTQTKSINGHQPLLLNDPQTIWLVQSGLVAVFAVALENGTVKGDRRHLFNVKSGEALFGAELTGAALGLLAIALEPTEIEAVPFSAVTSKLSGELETWITQLGQIQGLPQPPASALILQTPHVSLLSGQTMRADGDRVVWIQVQRGHLLWLGNPDLCISREQGLVPLAQNLYLQAQEQAELLVQSTVDLTEPAILWRGLAQLQTQLFHSIATLQEMAAKTEVDRFQNRQQLNRQVTQRAIRGLAGVLHPQPVASLSAETPVLVAAGAIGKALGVTIQPPLKSENLQRVKEPLEAIARSSQLRLRRVLLRGQWWQKDGEPLLAYTRGDRRPIALIPTGNCYEWFDPASLDATDLSRQPFLSHSTPHASILITPALAQTLDPVAYVFYRPLPHRLHALALLRFVLQGRQKDILMILLTGVAAALLGMIIPQATAILIDDAIPFGNTRLLWQLGLGLLAATVGATCFQLTQAIASMRIETFSDVSLQTAVWDRLLKLQTSFFRQYATGDLNSRVSGISAIRRKLSGAVLQSIFSGFFSLLNLGLLFYFSPPLALLAVFVALVIAIFSTISGSLLIKKHRPLMELEGNIFGLMVQLINGVPKLRIAGAEARAFAYWGQEYVQQLRLTLSTQRLEDGVALFNTVLPTLTTVALFWLASTLIDPTQMFSGDQLTTGSFLAFNVAFGTFIAGVASLSNTVVEVLDIIPVWQRSQPILQAQPEVDLDKADPGRLIGRIAIEHVTFRYREDGPLILDDVTITAQPGEFIALVGPSGSGKSTVIRLLLGFETPLSGRILYDGQDLTGLDVAAVRRQLGVVLQNGRINAGSIFENISGGAVISLEDAWKAAEMAGFAADVQAMPMQMHTLISEGGTNLSGGQRQRLVIARALALHPHILLFDEATSALDNRTQAIVSQSLDRLKVTRIVIAHRLSTIRYADRIYVLEAGRVVQSGTFAALAEQPGLFAQLIRRQLA